MEKRELCVGDVVQIDPSCADGVYAGAFMVVTDPGSSGAKGFLISCFYRGEMPKKIYYRASWEQMEYVGPASWVLGSEVVD